jgi:rhodanese-related sulfurtransferase
MSSSNSKLLLIGGGLAAGLLLLAILNRKATERTSFFNPQPIAKQESRPSTTGTVKEVTPTKQIADSLASFNVIDVREPGERVDTGFVPTSVNIPLAFVLDGSLDIPKDKPLLMVCRSGARSMKASQALLARGFNDITNLTGGTLGWIAAGLAVDRVSAIKQAVPSKQLESNLDKYHVVDVREPEELAKTGIIPTSVNLPLETILQGTAKIPVGKPLLLVCQVNPRSMRAAEALLKRGYDVTNLKGGTDEWIQIGLNMQRQSN